MFCIFLDPNGWATGRELHPSGFSKVASLEAASGATIKKGLTVIQQADKGVSTLDLADPFVRHQAKLAMGLTYESTWIGVPEGQWRLPAGAYKRCGGPT